MTTDNDAMGKEKKPRQPRGRPVVEYLMTVSEAAAHKGVSDRAVRQAIDEGRLPASKLGHQWALRRKDVDAWQPRKEWGPGRPRVQEEADDEG